MFFSLQPEDAVIADSNSDLMNLYSVVRDCPDAFLNRLAQFKNSEEGYYLVRIWEPDDAVSNAVRFYYLMLLSFNGIYRENLQGKFNVPYGRKDHLELVDRDHISRISILLRKAEIRTGDFEQTLLGCQEGDFVYIDPPYTVAHGQNGFIKYNDRIFSWLDQKRLATEVKRLVRMKCYVIVSNADHGSVRELYPEEMFEHTVITRTSQIAANGLHRRKVTELLIQSRGMK